MPSVAIVTHTRVLVLLVLALAGVLPETGSGHGRRPVFGHWSELPGGLRSSLEAGMSQETADVTSGSVNPT